MSTLSISHPAQSATVQTYWKNIGQAVIALVGAVLAAKPLESDTAVATAADDSLAQAKKPSLYRLYRLAGQYDSVMPSLAQELRIIARG
jgi:hypothetical protein